MALNGALPFTSTYDSENRILTTVTPENRTSTVTLDPAGRPLSFQVGNLAPVNLFYDARGKLSELRQGGRGWRYNYDALGRLDLVRDTLERMTRYTYDESDRVLAQQLPAGHVVGYAYDANGNLTGLTPPGRPQHLFLHTPVDLTERYTPPAAGIPDPATRYEYSLDRELEKVTRPDGGVVDLQYGATTGRLEAIVHPRGSNLFTYWDTPQPGTMARSGQLKSVTSPDTVTVNYAYDGPLLRSETWSGAVAGAVEHEYDAGFRESLERVTVGGTSDTVGFAYDRDGLLVRAGPMTIHRRASDGLAASTAVGAVTGSLGYDSHGELVELHYSRNGIPYFRQHLERDSLGRIERIDETWEGVTTSRRYVYDVAERLERVQDGTGAQLRRYAYDLGGLGNGNRTAERGASDELLAAGGYDDQDRLTSYGVASYEWTAAGELVRRLRALDTLTTTYDALGNLVEAGLSGPPILSPVPPGQPPPTNRIRYRVDGQDRRVAKLINGTPVGGWLYRDALRLAAELDGAGTLLHRYVFATRDHVPDLLMRGDTAYRMVTDHLGSVRAVVRTTDGVVVERRDYDPWGVPTLEAGVGFQSLGYAGGLTDPNTRLVRFGTRDYDPEVGRWTASDPLGIVDESFNRFIYAINDPVGNIDPSGTIPWPLPKKGDHWRHYGNWGGPGWRNRGYGSELGNYGYLPSHRHYVPPVDARDECYREHDVSLRKCAQIEDPVGRWKCRAQSDVDLADCLYSLGDRGCKKGARDTWLEQQFFRWWQPNRRDGPGDFVP